MTAARPPAALPALLIVLAVLILAVAAYWATVRAERQAEATRPNVPSMMVDPEDVLRRSRPNLELPQQQMSGGPSMSKEEAKAFADAAGKRHAETARRMQKQMGEIDRILRENPGDPHQQIERQMRRMQESMRQGR